MIKYFTPVTRASNTSGRDVYVEELSSSCPSFGICKRFNLIFSTRDEAKQKAYEIISKEGGTFLDVLPSQGRKNGSRKLGNELPKTYLR